MLASLRAELLILRKWRAAQALLLVAPLLTLVSSYLLPYLKYRTVTFDQYATVGSPSQILPTILPNQLVIVVMGNFGFSATAPFVVLGAVMSGGDWGRGTIKTALLQRSGRLPTFAGQVLALAVALAASVLLTFAVAGAASLAISWLEAGAGSPADAALPTAATLVKGLAVGLLVSLSYGAAGLALGTLFRSAGAAIAAALLWTVVAQAVLDNLALQVGGFLQTVNNALPNASAVSITSVFGAPGGGAEAATYYRVQPALSVWVLLGYTAAFLALAAVLLRRRDVGVVTAGRGHRRLLPGAAVPSGVDPGGPGRVPAHPDDYPPDGSLPLGTSPAGVLSSLRAELLVLRRWPAVWAFVLVMPAYTLLNSYLVQYVFYRTAGSGVFVGLSPDQILPDLLPGQFAAVSLSNFGFSAGLDGTVAFLLLGALVAGSDWGEGTIKTSLLQGPGRVQTSIGQALAVLVTVAAAVVLTFALAGTASVLIALAETGAASPAESPFPALANLVQGLAGGLLVCVTYAAAGLALGTLFRSAGGAIAAALLWSVILRSVLDNLALLLHGDLQAVYNFLPSASTTTLTHLFGAVGNSQLPLGPHTDVSTAAWVLLGYAVAFLALPALVTRRRDIV